MLTYAIDQLIHSDDAEVRTATNDFDWHIFPILNPDGHEFSQDSVSGFNAIILSTFEIFSIQLYNTK